MDNFERRVRYAAQNRRWRQGQAAILLPHYIQAGVEDLLVRPGPQARRIRKHRFDATAERQQRREARELARNRRNLWLWDVLTPRVQRAVLRDVQAAPAPAQAGTPWARPDADVKGDLARLAEVPPGSGVTPDTGFYGDATPELAQQAASEIAAIFGPPGSDRTAPGTFRIRSIAPLAGRTPRTQPRRNTRRARQAFQRKAG